MFGRTILKTSVILDAYKLIERLGAEARMRDVEIARLEGELRAARSTIHQLDNEIRSWQAERLSLHTAMTAARVMSDLLRVELNATREKEAAFLAQLLPSLKVAVPKMESGEDLFLGGTSPFDDMGDREASRHGLVDLRPFGTPETHGAPKAPPEAPHAAIGDPTPTV